MKDRLEFESEHDVRKVKAMLSKELTGAPGRSASDILATAPVRPKRSRRWAYAAAAAILAAVLVSSLTVAPVAQALARVPLVGELYRELIKESGLNLAYEAGFVTELNKSVTKGDLTLTVIGAYTDSEETVVLFTLQTTDENPEQRLMEVIQDYSIRLKGIGSYGWHARTNKDIMYGQIESSEPIPWWSFNELTLLLEPRVQDSPAVGGLKVSFPVQRLDESLVVRRQIDQEFVYHGEKYTIKEIVFTPARTVLHYYHRPSADSSSQSNHTANWSLTTVTGSELQRYGGSYTGSTGLGQVEFAPTMDKDVVVRFKGWHVMAHEDVMLPLQAGQQAATPFGTAEIVNIESSAEETLVTLNWVSDGDIEYSLTKMSAYLIESDSLQPHSPAQTASGDAKTSQPAEEEQHGIRMKHMAVTDSEIILTFAALEQDYSQYQLRLSTILVEHAVDIEVVNTAR